MRSVPLTSRDQSSGQEIQKETTTLNDTLDQINLIDIITAFHSKQKNTYFFSSAPGTFFSINYMLGHKTSLNKFKKIEIIPSIFSDQML